MSDPSTYQQIFKIGLLIIAWYIVSSANNVLGKIILEEFPYPMTVSMVQLLSVSFYSYPLIRLRRIPTLKGVPTKYWFTMILPLAAGKFISSFSAYMSIWKVPLSYAHTGKFYDSVVDLVVNVFTRVYMTIDNRVLVFSSKESVYVQLFATPPVIY